LSLFAGILAMLLFTGCSSTAAPDPDAVALKPNTLDSIDYELPAPFYGCWEGTIDTDSVTPLDWAGKHLRSEPQTYQLCYRHRPEGGGDLVLTKFEVSGGDLNVVAFDNHVTAVDEKLRTSRLRNHVLVEQGHDLMWLFPVYGREDIYADENIAMKNDNLIEMTGKELIQLNGADTALATFHGTFHRLPNQT
jgi:hypothetical protein